MTFEEIRSQAISEWEALKRDDKPHLLVGTATCGRAAGAMEVIQAIETELAQHKIDAVIRRVGCMGLCYAEVLVDIIKPGRPRICYQNITPEMIPELIEDYILKDNFRPDLALGTIGDESIDGIPRLSDLAVLASQVRVALRNCGYIDPERINEYIANDGYMGLVKALKTTPDSIIEVVKKSGLRGRGGAGFPTGRKWQFCHDASGEGKYVVCNADEGDPGAFMDRAVLESDPHSVLEGMIIAGYSVGAERGYIYVRAEYPLAIKRLQIAIAQAREKGFLGKNILGSGFNFDIAIFKGAGAFVCGEETALILSLEGKRGAPYLRPPYPAISGLQGKPTLLNNVETFACVSSIIVKGSSWFGSMGTERSKGTKVFALAGKIKNTGLVEVPMGTTLRTVIFDIGGGVPDGKRFKAVQTGGPSGGCIPLYLLDLPVDYEALTQAGSIMGSGGMLVMDEDTCMVDVARYFLDFTQKESCGQCLPCKLGTKQMFDILDDSTKGQGKSGDIDLLIELAEAVKKSSFCALGGTAPNPVLTTIHYFRDEYEAHINEKRCPTLLCRALISYRILPDKCECCLICLRNCPAQAISGGKKQIHVIDQDKCSKCGICLEVCPERFSAVERVSGAIPVSK